MSAAKKKELSGRMVLTIFIGFFLLVFLANGIMTFVAIDTFSGVETQDAYRKGRDYNDTLQESRNQAALSWQASLNAVSLGDNRLAIGVDVFGKEGTALRGAAVELTLLRPTVKGMDVVVTLPETSPGIFASEIVVPAAGNWKALVTVTSASGDTYRLEKKLFVKG